MNKSAIREKFFDLWSNQLSPEEAKDLRAMIASDPVLQRELTEDVALFESLGDLKGESLHIPEDFAASVSAKINQRGFLYVLWRKVMQAIRSIGWLMILGVLIPCAVALCVVGLSFSPWSSQVQTAVEHFVNSGFGAFYIEPTLRFLEGRGGVFLLLLLLTYAITSLPLRAFRMSAAAVTAALAVFFIRTASTAFFTTESIDSFELEEHVVPAAPPVHKQKAPIASSHLPAAVERYMSIGDAAAPAGFGAGMIAQDVISIPQESRENYGQYEENPRMSVQSDPVSTFSIDVDTGSYANIRRFLRLGQLPPKNAVRIEELVNYFPYNYAADGDKPFSVHYEIAPSPLSKGRYLMKIGLKAHQAVQDRSKGWNLVFLVDTSGSMNESNKLPLVKQSLKLLTDAMRKEDRIALVTYAGSAGVVLPSTSGDEKDKIRAAIDGLESGGSTNGSAGIDLAYAQAESNKIAGSVNRVILATDGDFNVGISDFNGLVDLIEKKRKLGITLTTLGFGTGNYQERSMEQLADKGNGNYFYIDSFQEAKKVLSSELTQTMEVVAKDVKLQVEFNPAQVREYRLIGFDNRMLKREDFTNDKIDAGEVGSGHTVTALYELELTSHPVRDSSNEPLRYQTPAPVPTAVPLQGELGFLKIRAKTPEGENSTEYQYPVTSSIVKSSIDETSDDFRFAAAVAGFGTLLRESKYEGDLNWSDVRSLAEKARGEDPFGYRSEFLSLVDAAKVLK